MSMVARRKRQTIGTGDVFLVPLSDGSWCAGQLLQITKKALNSCICAFFDVRLLAESDIVNRPLHEANLFAVQFVTPESLKKALWPIVENREVTIDLERYIPLDKLQQHGFVGAKIVGDGIIDDFLNAYYGLRTWDDFHDPNYFDKLLASPGKRPADVILTKAK